MAEKTIRKGCRGNVVRTLQKALHLVEDGIFGDITEEAVKDFQRTNGLTPDGVVGEKTWKALGLSPNKRNIDEIIVHCTATKEGKDFTIADITRWHKARGYTTIGYHYVVYRDGRIMKGRDENIVGAHCKNHNTRSIGVCYVGGCGADGLTPKDTRTIAQISSLLSLLRDLRRKYPKAKIYGHRDFAAKACPSFDATREYATI